MVLFHLKSRRAITWHLQHLANYQSTAIGLAPAEVVVANIAEPTHVENSNAMDVNSDAAKDAATEKIARAQE